MSAALDLAAERRIIEACEDPSGVLGFLPVYREHRSRAARRGQAALCDEIDDLIEFAEDHVVALKAEGLRERAPREERRGSERSPSAPAMERVRPMEREPAEQADLAAPWPHRPRPALTLRRVVAATPRPLAREPASVEEDEPPATRPEITVARSVRNPEVRSADPRGAERAAARRAAEEAEAEGARADAELRELHARINRANARRDAAIAEAARLDAAAKKAAADAEQARRAAAARDAARAVAAAEREAEEAEAAARRAAQPTVPARTQAVALPEPTPAPRVPVRDPAPPPSVASMLQARLAAIGCEVTPGTQAATRVPPPNARLAPPPTLVAEDGAQARVPRIGASPPALVAPHGARPTPSTPAETPTTDGGPSLLEPPPPAAQGPGVRSASAAMVSSTKAAPPPTASTVTPPPPAPVTVPSPPAETDPYLLGGDLIAFRQRIGASQRALAGRLGVDQGAISRAEGRPTALLPPALHRALHSALPGTAAAS